MVDGWWKEFQVVGKKSYVLKEKLKLLKQKLRVGYKEVFNMLVVEVEKKL